MIKRLSTVILALVIPLMAIAQAVPCVTIRTSASELSMGGVCAASGSDFEQRPGIFEAEIGKTFYQTSAIGYNLTNYMARIWAMKNLSFGFKCTTNSMKDIELYGSSGQPLGTFHPSELSAGLEFKFLPISNLSFTATGKLIRSTLAENHSAKCMAADLCGRWQPVRNITAALAVENLGGEVDYGYGAYPLPTTYKAGIGGLLPIGSKFEMEAAADFGTIPAYSAMVICAGTGCIYNRTVALRLGAHISTNGEILPTYATIGAAYLSDIFDISGAYMTAANSFSISVKLKL